MIHVGSPHSQVASQLSLAFGTVTESCAGAGNEAGVEGGGIRKRTGIKGIRPWWKLSAIFI